MNWGTQSCIRALAISYYSRVLSRYIQYSFLLNVANLLCCAFIQFGYCSVAKNTREELLLVVALKRLNLANPRIAVTVWMYFPK